MKKTGGYFNDKITVYLLVFFLIFAYLFVIFFTIYQFIVGLYSFITPGEIFILFSGVIFFLMGFFELFRVILVEIYKFFRMLFSGRL
jgi:hypothetical protein